MPSLGHGISDAVRNHIPVWVDDTLVDVLYEEHRKTGGPVIPFHAFNSRMRKSDEWVRKSRSKTASGFERMYRNKLVPKATLKVHSPKEDDCANAYVFSIDDKTVAGGRTKLKSTHVTKLVSKDKTSTKPQEVEFVKFTETELRNMRIRMEFDGGLDRLEQARGD